MTWAPSRGEVVWLTMGPALGHEQTGRRPAVVLSPGAYNDKVGLAVVCPVTSRVKGYPFEVLVPAGLPVGGAILADQVRSLDWRAHDAELICTLPAGSTREVLEKVGTLLDIPE